MSSLTHFSPQGDPHMVDVSAKPVTARSARAEAFVTLRPETLQLIASRTIAKGDVLGIAQLGGILAAKKTGELIPLCHPLGLDACDVTIEPVDQQRLRIVATTRVLGRTGVEMEALTAASVAALTIYDMCKSVDRTITIGPVRLLEKHGGRSGDFHAEPTSPEGS